MLKAVLLDLDGTLLPMDEDKFTQGYFAMLCIKLAPYGYNSEELIKAIWAGTKAMIMNDGAQTNAHVFWDCFAKLYGEEKVKDEPLFTDFYRNEFKAAKKFCGDNPKARELIDFIKSQGLKIILASNPLFPHVGMVNRLNFIDLNENDFDYITSYESAHYSKPNPQFYQEILEKIQLNANEVIYFGNSKTEDYDPASKIGIKTYLVGTQGIKFDDIIKVIKNEISGNF